MLSLPKTLVAGAAFTLLTLGAPSSAQAETPAGWALRDVEARHGFHLFGYGFVEGGPSFGGGLLVGIPIPPAGQGFIPTVNDAFFVEAGAQFGGVVLSGPTLEFMGGVQYRVHLFDWLAPYAYVRGGAGAFFVPGGGKPVPLPVVHTGVGAVFTVHEVLGIRVEGGYPGFKVGVNITLP